MMVEPKPADKPAMASTVAGDMPWLLEVVMCKPCDRGLRGSGTEYQLYVEVSCRNRRPSQDDILQLGVNDTMVIFRRLFCGLANPST